MSWGIRYSISVRRLPLQRNQRRRPATRSATIGAFKDGQRGQHRRPQRDLSKVLGASSKDFECGVPATSRRNQSIAMFLAFAMLMPSASPIAMRSLTKIRRLVLTIRWGPAEDAKLPPQYRSRNREQLCCTRFHTRLSSLLLRRTKRNSNSKPLARSSLQETTRLRRSWSDARRH